MSRLVVLIDSRRYVRENCYLGQLAITLRRNFDVRFVSCRELAFFAFTRLRQDDIVLSMMRLRSLHANRALVKRYLADKPLVVYDQDPWESFMDASPLNGAYARIAADIKVTRFLLTSQWWANFVAARGFPTRFVRMGILPEYCDPGPAWDDRPHALAFQGTIHKHRRAFFDRLGEMGIAYDLLPSTDYPGYLRNLHKMQIYIHSEDTRWRVAGEDLPPNALWIKETEVASRGTFAIRNEDADIGAYALHETPTVYAFKDTREIPSILAAVRAMPADERRNRMLASVAAMKRRDDWMSVVAAIRETASASAVF